MRALELCGQDLRDLDQLLLLLDCDLSKFLILAHYFFCYLLNLGDESLFIGSEGFNDRVDFREQSIHCSREGQVALLLVLQSAQELECRALERAEVRLASLLEHCFLVHLLNVPLVSANVVKKLHHVREVPAPLLGLLHVVLICVCRILTVGRDCLVGGLGVFQLQELLLACLKIYLELALFGHLYIGY